MTTTKYVDGFVLPLPNDKEKVVSRIYGETSSNQILARFLLVKSPTKGLNALYSAFRERTPYCALRSHLRNEEPGRKRTAVSGSVGNSRCVVLAGHDLKAGELIN
jgi:hypothetical protein